jgi:glucose uptake protein GlcU
MLLGFLETPFALAQGGITRTDYFTEAVFTVVIGGLIFLPSLGVLLGFGPTVSGTFHSLGILGVIYVIGSIINAAVAVTNPVGGGRYLIPWTMLGVVAFRAWRGRWVGAILILLTWAISTTITLFMARG